MRPINGLASLAFLLLMSSAAAPSNAQPLPNPGDSSSVVLRFDMWCLEIELLPEARCAARKPEDLKSYELYRSRAERFQQERATQARREKEVSQKLQRDPTATSRTGAGP
jgi:hypothetical protein